jgi:hypothetical protein
MQETKSLNKASGLGLIRHLLRHALHILPHIVLVTWQCWHHSVIAAAPMLAKPGAFMPKPATPVEISLMTAATAVSGDLPSPANSNHSQRSLRSEALSQLSMNAVTIRKVWHDSQSLSGWSSLVVPRWLFYVQGVFRMLLHAWRDAVRVLLQKKNKENRAVTPNSAKRSPVPEHSVMHIGMMD